MEIPQLVYMRLFPIPQPVVKEGYLMKQTRSFQRWQRRYFRLRGRTLYYAKEKEVSDICSCVQDNVCAVR
ncbi:unnamed protein product, partial [Iphiclides podalirius]